MRVCTAYPGWFGTLSVSIFSVVAGFPGRHAATRYGTVYHLNIHYIYSSWVQAGASSREFLSKTNWSKAGCGY